MTALLSNKEDNIARLMTRVYMAPKKIAAKAKIVMSAIVSIAEGLNSFKTDPMIASLSRRKSTASPRISGIWLIRCF